MQPSPNTMAELRSATWPSHQRLEKHLDIKARFADRPSYRTHLERMWGFCAAIEQQLDDGVLDEALGDYDRRRKRPLLARDLVALGVDAKQLVALPRCQLIPACADAASAFGCLYVLEGASLGGRTLLPMIQNKLGLDAEHGAAFLASYGADVTPMWNRFSDALNAWCHTEERSARAVRNAIETFDALDQWLCGHAA